VSKQHEYFRFLTLPSGRRQYSIMIRRGYSSHGAAIHRAAEKGNSFYDDVMQAVFSFFFSFLFLSSL